jgi:hypothetical protein
MVTAMRASGSAEDAMVTTTTVARTRPQRRDDDDRGSGEIRAARGHKKRFSMYYCIWKYAIKIIIITK